MKLKFGSWSPTPYLIAVMLVGLQACGGGDDAPPPPPADANPTGYYKGTAEVKLQDDTTDVTITNLHVMINGNVIRMMNEAQTVVYSGTFTISGNDIQSTVKIFENSSEVGNASLSATVTEKSQLTGTFTGAGLGNGTFVSTYSTLNNTASSATTIDAGVKKWWCSVASDTSNMALEVNGSGVTTSEITVNGLFKDCSVSGNIIPIASTALYLVELSTSNCSTTNNPSPNTVTSGLYTGLAMITDEVPVSSSNRLVLSASNDSYSLGDECYVE